MQPIDLPVSDKLSILKNAAGTFAGRKLGILLTDGIDPQMLDNLTAAFEAEGATVERIAAKVYGVPRPGESASRSNTRSTAPRPSSSMRSQSSPARRELPLYR